MGLTSCRHVSHVLASECLEGPQAPQIEEVLGFLKTSKSDRSPDCTKLQGLGGWWPVWTLDVIPFWGSALPV